MTSNTPNKKTVTVELTEELYDQLVEVAEKVSSQDNRATAKPYFFQVQSQEVVWSRDPDQYENETFLDPSGDYTQIDPTIEEVKILCERYDEPYPEGVNTWSIDQIHDFLESEKFNLEKGSYGFRDVYSNAFFTEEACRNHIDRNRHHYNRPVDFLSHAFRNSEMEIMFRLFEQLLTR